jgi:hypothetical protein
MASIITSLSYQAPNGVIYFFSLNAGTLTWTTISGEKIVVRNAFDDMELDEVLGMCVSGDHLFVAHTKQVFGADEDLHCMLVFRTDDGTPVCQFGGDVLTYPRDLYISPNNVLLVTNMTGEIIVFDVSDLTNVRYNKPQYICMSDDDDNMSVITGF